MDSACQQIERKQASQSTKILQSTWTEEVGMIFENTSGKLSPEQVNSDLSPWTVDDDNDYDDGDIN